MNGSARTFHPYTTIRRPYISGKKLKSFIFTLSMDVLKGFIFILLLEATDREKENSRT